MQVAAIQTEGSQLGGGDIEIACATDSEVIGRIDTKIAGSDVVLMSSDLTPLVTGRDIAARTVSIVKQNIRFIIGCKLLFIILSLMGSLPMWMAVFADVGVTLITVLNSARLLRIK